MATKVCILAAGITKRIGEFSDNVNKAVLPVDNKAVISHVIERFPKDAEFVFALGHRKDSIVDYLTLAYPERKFTFVEVEKYVGEGTGPAYSLLECRDHLQEPFILCTADTIVLEDIPDASENWFGVAPVSAGKSKQYCTVTIENGRIARISDKVENGGTNAFIGLAGVKDYAQFFVALQRNKTVISGEVQLSNGFEALIDNGIAAKRFTWFDTGNLEGYEAVNRHFTDAGAFNFSKEDEFLYFVNGKIIKFFADESVARNRIARASMLQGLCPALTGATKHFYAYDMVPGAVVYDRLSADVARQFFTWANGNLWKRKTLGIEQQAAFDKACRRFYKDKTMERIARFFTKTRNPDHAAIVNGQLVAPLGDLLPRIDWEHIYRGIPSNFHGDLQFDNVLVNDDGGFTLLDWRQDFGGLLEYGDLYYDLAKLYGGLIISYKGIKQNNFSFAQAGNEVTIDLQETPQMAEARHVYEELLQRNGYDLRKVQTITGLIFLNMSPLHQPPFDSLLFYLGRSVLQRSLV